MATRNGKVANLPSDIREQLNLRLLEGETGRELAAWLNALPEVQSVLGAQFNGSPISEVNLTYWRQGGYLQWLTERECFDSARALAKGDCNLADAGLTAERLLNILTLRYGELLMRWDFSPDEGVPKTTAFSEVAKKARILQAISRSVLAIHRIQSQSACSNADRQKSSSDSTARSSVPSTPTSKSASPPHRPSSVGSAAEAANTIREPVLRQSRDQNPESAQRLVDGTPSHLRPLRAARVPAGANREILSGPISPSSILSNLSQTPFKADADLAEVLKAV